MATFYTAADNGLARAVDGATIVMYTWCLAMRPCAESGKFSCLVSGLGIIASSVRQDHCGHRKSTLLSDKRPHNA